MPSKISSGLVLLLLAPAFSQQRVAVPLVDYHFDDEELTTGPDTFAIFQSTKGSVQLSGSYRYSGLRSLEIRSVAGDKDFPELQGYFPVQEKGSLSIQFALLVTNPQEPINIALAGPSHFTERRHGLAFWLKVDQGVLNQVTGQKTQPLFTLRPFVWYLVQCVYHVEEGVYDLEIREEYGPQPLVALTAQKNVMNEPGSTLDRYSFVSNPFGNNSNALFYVDDVRIVTDADVALGPFVAPGRRKLFVDRYNDLRKRLAVHTFCLPVSDLADLGVSTADAHRLQQEGALEWLQQALQTNPKDLPSGLSDDAQRRLSALGNWKRGCEQGALGDDKAALKLFEDAARQAPEARVYEVSVILAEAARKNWTAANERWSRAQQEWRHDIRFAFISAQLGLARGNLDEAELTLRGPAEQLPIFSKSALGQLWGGSLDAATLKRLQQESPERWPDAVETELIAEQYYYVLLWNGRYADARRYAASVIEPLKQLGLPTALWIERCGDALFFDRNYVSAREMYEKTLEADPKSGSAYSKLSDVWFTLGDREKERFYREGMYGALK